MTHIIALIGGCALGALIVWLAMKAGRATREADLRADIGRKEEEVRHQADTLARVETDLRQAREDRGRLGEEATGLRESNAGLKTALDGERRNAAEKLRLLQDAQDQLKKEFENLANRIFEAKGEKFVSQNREQLDGILRPLREQLGEFKKRVEDVYDKESQGRVSLLSEIKHLKDLNQQISADAVNLTKALRGESKTRGNWGELVIERVLQQSGLQAGREYETQVHLKDRYGGTGSRYPDFVVHLPEKKDVVVDAKVALNAYDTHCAAESDEERAAALRDHVRAVRNHVNELGAKDYENLDGINSLDLVVMCVPNEPAFISAVAEDRTLYDDAFAKKIMLVGPSTLLLTLRIIATIWRTEYQNRNALQIAERGQLLYTKFVNFVQDLEGIGENLRRARQSYDDAHGKLTTGTGNLVGQAQKLVDLGVKAKKKLPQQLVDAGDDTATPQLPESRDGDVRESDP